MAENAQHLDSEDIEAMGQALKSAQAEVERHLEAIRVKDERIGELEAEVGRLKREVEAEVAGRDQEIASLREQMATAVARYRSLVLAQAPELPEDLVTGETVDEIDASMASVQALVDRVRKQLEARVAVESVPAGAPPRTLPDLSALSPREKIAYALARQQKG